MYLAQEFKGPRRLRRRPPNYVENEVILTTIKRARNDELPHYLNVAAGASAPSTSYGDAAIDGVLQRLGRRTTSIARVFVPQRVVSDAETDFMSLASTAIVANYRRNEDDAGLSRTYRVAFEGQVDPFQVCEELQSSKAVERAQPNFISEVRLQPNDEFYGFQWGLPAIGCEDGWEIETGHPDVRIAIVDSGVDLQHEDLAPKLAAGFDFVDFQGSGGARYTLLGDYKDRDDNPQDEDGHGSHCAGISAAASDNGTGVAGVCHGGKIVPIRVMFRVFDNFEGRETSVGTDADIDAGIKFAVDSGVHAINLSLGGDSPSHEQVLNYAFDQNVCVVAATGNDNSSTASYPASNPKVLAVGAVDANLQRASFSNYGPAYNRFVVAPGVEIASTYKDNGYVYLQGTSMATPFVAGLAGLLASQMLRAGRSLPVSEIYEIIRTTAKPLGTGKDDLFTGEGLIDVQAALEAVQKALSCGDE